MTYRQGGYSCTRVKEEEEIQTSGESLFSFIRPAQAGGSSRRSTRAEIGRASIICLQGERSCRRAQEEEEEEEEEEEYIQVGRVFVLKSHLPR